MDYKVCILGLYRVEGLGTLGIGVWKIDGLHPVCPSLFGFCSKLIYTQF